MILLNDFQRQWQDLREPLERTFSEVGASGWYVLGKEVREFEAALATFWGLKHCIGVASGLDAIEIGLRILGCRAGDRVLTTPVSAFATTLAILKIGAIPVFVDTDEFGHLDLELTARVLAGRPEIRHVVPVHLYGIPLDLERLASLRERFDVKILEDCAQSIGSTFGGRPTGSVGHLTATSFYPTKNLGAFGDGGAILVNDESAATEAKSLRDYGQTSKYRHDVCGYNSRLDELQAALLHRAMLPSLNHWTERRRAVASAYLSGIVNPAVHLIGARESSEPCWHLFPVLVDSQDKAAFMAYLKSRGVSSGEHYPVPIHQQKALLDATYEVAGTCDTAERICSSEVSLPIHPYLTGEEVSQVVEVVNAWRA